MEASNHQKNDIIQWLESVLSKDNVSQISADVLGNTEKWDNFIGDIIFVRVSGITADNITKKYELVLKCSKRSKLLREKTPVKAAYYNEIFIYETIFPSYTRFQRKAAVPDIFDNVPKHYGTFIGDDVEVILLENLKMQGYYLWDKKNPMPLNYVSLVAKTYGKLHATAAAMIDQQPGKLQEWTEAFRNLVKDFKRKRNVERRFGGAIEEIWTLLKDDLDEDVLQKWMNLKGEAVQILDEVNENFAGFRVIVHGDCWNNNFMFHSDTGNPDVPSRVVILDWQTSRLSTPILDLSFFLFSCISADDLENVQFVLDEYYESFFRHLKQLGSDPDAVFPKSQFLHDWQKYSKTGLLFCCTALKVCVMDSDEAPDVVKTIEAGGDFGDIFRFDVRNEKGFANRIGPIVKYVAEHGLI